jgi:hypothetical protein
LAAKGQNLKNGFHRSRMEKAAFSAAFFEPDSQTALLAEMPPAVLAAEPGAGDAHKTVAAGVLVAASRGGGNGSRGADRAADDTGRDIARPDAAVIVEAVIAVLPSAALRSPIPIGLIPIGLALVAAGIGASRSPVLAMGIWIELRAVAGIVDDFLRHRRAGERGRENRRGGENSCHGLTPLQGAHAKRSVRTIVPVRLFVGVKQP